MAIASNPELAALRASLEATADGILVVDRNGKFTLFNQRFVDMWRIPKTIIESGDDQQALDFVLDQLKAPEQFLKKVQDLYSHPDAESFDILEFNDGRIFERYSHPQRIGESIVGRVWTFRDVTAREQAVRELRDSEARYRALFEQIPHPAWVFDRNTFEFLAVNSAAIAHYGYSREEFLSMTVKDIRPKADTGKFVEFSQMAYEQRSGGPYNAGVWHHCKKDGSIIDVEIIVSPIVFNGRPAKLILARDVTDRNRAERERLELERKIVEAQKLESLAVLTGGIAHDFNNMLATVIGSVNLIKMQNPPEAIQASLNCIETVSQRAAELCKQMLAYSGKNPFVVQRVDLNALIRETVELLKVTFTINVTVRLELNPALRSIQADASQMRRVLMNLVINAAEAIGDKPGTISISSAMKKITAVPSTKATSVLRDPHPGEYIMLSVADNGCGMPPEILAKIFDPYFTTKFAGRGLGLAAVMGIVRSHKGYIHVESDPGAGTTFTILLPAN